MFKAGMKFRNLFGWILGKGDISFWFDTWLDKVPLAEYCGSQVLDQAQRVSDFWVEEQWNEEELWRLSEEKGVPSFVIEEILLRGEKDRPRWKLTSNGNFEVASAWELVRDRAERREVHDFIWDRCMGPTISMFLWRLLANRIPVDTKLQWRGVELASRCRCCRNPNIESRLHLFVNGDGAREVWNHFARWFPQVPDFVEEGVNIDLRLRWWQRHMNVGSRQHICRLIPCLILWFLWTERNSSVHRDIEFRVENVIKRIIGYLRNLVLARLLGAEQWRGCCPKVNFMSVPPCVGRHRKVVKVQWRPPEASWFKVNTNGAFQGVTGRAGSGGVVRDEKGELRAAFAVNLKAGSGLEAEAWAVLQGLNLEKQFGDHIWIEVDAELIANWLSTRQLGSAIVRHIFVRIRRELKGITWRVSHILREGNKAADFLADLGLRSSSSAVFTNEPAPARVKAICRLDQLGLPNFRF